MPNQQNTDAHQKRTSEIVWQSAKIVRKRQTEIMAIPPFLIFLSLCIIISQEASVNHGSFENVRPVTFTGFDNNLGTYIEYRGQVLVGLGGKSWRVVIDIEYFHIGQESLLSGYKALAERCSLQECLKLPAQPNVNKLFDTFNQLGTTNEKTDSRRSYMINCKTLIDQLRNQNKLAKESKNDFPTIMLAQLRHLASEMERQANKLLEELKCTQLNTKFRLDKEISSEILQDINIRMSDLLEDITKKVLKLNYKTLAFDYTLPKISKDRFRIYHLTPIPKVHRNGTIEILDIQAPYLAVNNKTERYFVLHDLEHCLKVKNNEFICELPISEMKYAEDLVCGVAAVLNQSSAACTSHLVVQQSILTPLVAPNSWMATVTKEESLLVLCSVDDSEHELKINGSGILRIRADCTVRLGTSVVLRGEHREWDDSNLAYASLQTKTETAVDLFQSHVDQVIRDSITKLKEEHIQPGTIEHPYVIGAAVLLIILLLMALLYCHLRPQPGNDVEVDDAYQRLRVHFRFRSGKTDITEEQS